MESLENPATAVASWEHTKIWLPADVYQLIISYLTIRQIFQTRRVNKLWKNIIDTCLNLPEFLTASTCELQSASVPANINPQLQYLCGRQSGEGKPHELLCFDPKSSAIVQVSALHGDQRFICELPWPIEEVSHLHMATYRCVRVFFNDVEYEGLERRPKQSQCLLDLESLDWLECDKEREGTALEEVNMQMRCFNVQIEEQNERAFVVLDAQTQKRQVIEFKDRISLDSWCYGYANTVCVITRRRLVDTYISFIPLSTTSNNTVNTARHLELGGSVLYMLGTPYLYFGFRSSRKESYFIDLRSQEIINMGMESAEECKAASLIIDRYLLRLVARYETEYYRGYYACVHDLSDKGKLLKTLRLTNRPLCYGRYNPSSSPSNSLQVYPTELDLLFDGKNILLISKADRLPISRIERFAFSK